MDSVEVIALHKNMVEDACRAMYGSSWDGPADRMPGERMKEVWRTYARKCLASNLAALAANGQDYEAQAARIVELEAGHETAIKAADGLRDEIDWRIKEAVAQAACIAALEAALTAIDKTGADGEHSGDRHALCREIARDALSTTPAPAQGAVDPHESLHQFAVVSSDYSHPFLAGAYPTLERAVKAQCGNPDKWHIFQRVTPAPAQGGSDGQR